MHRLFRNKIFSCKCLQSFYASFTSGVSFINLYHLGQIELQLLRLKNSGESKKLQKLRQKSYLIRESETQERYAALWELRPAVGALVLPENLIPDDFKQLHDHVICLACATLGKCQKTRFPVMCSSF